MKQVIVTVTNPSKEFFCDVEVPTDVPVAQLKRDILETLQGYRPELRWGAGATALFCSRLGRPLDDGETFEGAGVWNGDYITLTEEKTYG